jgi:hypothetical protein
VAFSPHHNFVRIHQTLKVTPAMTAGVTDRLWEMKDLVEMLEAFEASQKRGLKEKPRRSGAISVIQSVGA